MSSSTFTSVDAASLSTLVAQIFAGCGASEAGARIVADSLVSAELEGVASHGVMLVPMYVGRVRAGSVVPSAEPAIVEDLGGLVLMSASHGFGQVSSRAAVDLAIDRARVHGLALVAVRHAFHFGTAAYWARRIAQTGMIGIACSNTRPLMPAPGGAERVVGNNPLALAFPSSEGEPLVVDMATSASAMGKIRIAHAKGESIPEGWAADANGRATTSPAAAIEGMLLPAAGPKGFGLAVAIDLLSGALSGGAFGAAVHPLYGPLDQPYDCAHTFMAIDAQRTADGTGIGAHVASFANAIRDSARAPGTQRIFAPGDLERARREQNAGRCELALGLIAQLNGLAQDAGAALRL